MIFKTFSPRFKINWNSIKTRLDTNHSVQRYSSFNTKNKPKVLNHLLFSIAFITIGFTTTTIIRSNKVWDDYQEKKLKLNTQSLWDLLSSKNTTQPGLIYKNPNSSFITNIKDMIIFRWKNTTNAEKLTISLISINTLVFVAWQFPKCHSFLSKHFTHSPIKNRPYTMLTATFSHENFLHFTFNMIALNSFLPLFQYSSGISNEQTLFFYLSAGVLSSLGSHLLSVFMPARAIVSSLGASGAIWGLLAACTYLRPQSQLGIVFLPGVHFRADEVLPLMMLVDAVGLVMRWQTFDHAAHLAGAIIGLIYVPYGIPFWSQVQTRLFNERRRSEEGGEYRK